MHTGTDLVTLKDKLVTLKEARNRKVGRVISTTSITPEDHENYFNTIHKVSLAYQRAAQWLEDPSRTSEEISSYDVENKPKWPNVAL